MISLKQSMNIEGADYVIQVFSMQQHFYNINEARIYDADYRFNH